MVIYMSFLESYKRLDNLCKDVFRSEKGVTTYIESMENTSYSFRPADFDSDYKNLHRYRHIRNQIAHDNYADESNMCDENDTLWIEQFYGRILNQTDPLSLQHKAMTEYQKQASKAKRTQEPIKYSIENKTPHRGSRVVWVVIIIALILISALLLLKHVSI